MSASIFEMNKANLGSDVLKPLANHRMLLFPRKSKYLFKSEYLPRPSQHRRVSMPSATSLHMQVN